MMCPLTFFLFCYFPYTLYLIPCTLYPVIFFFTIFAPVMTKHYQTLFLDRDGVLNKQIIGSYVMHPDQLEIKDGVVEALQILQTLFERIVIVTNQQGIAKGLMTESDLHKVHQKLTDTLGKGGISIDAIYYCPHLDKSGCSCRKPDIGMAKAAQTDFPGIDFQKSVMVGDNLSDILFGKRCGMTTVLVGDKLPHIISEVNIMPDYFCTDLLEFAHLISE